MPNRLVDVDSTLEKRRKKEKKKKEGRKKEGVGWRGKGEVINQIHRLSECVG